jgi:hypothetical protein
MGSGLGGPLKSGRASGSKSGAASCGFPVATGSSFRANRAAQVKGPNRRRSVAVWPPQGKKAAIPPSRLRLASAMGIATRCEVAHWMDYIRLIKTERCSNVSETRSIHGAAELEGR